MEIEFRRRVSGILDGGHSFEARVEWAGPSFRLIIVGERVLLPLAVGRIPIESDIGMNGHAIIGEHALVDALSDSRCDRLRRCRVDKQCPGLEDQRDSGAEIPAAAKPVGGRSADHEHFAALE